MFDKKSDAYLRPFSQAAEERTDSLIQAISTLRVEAYRAHAREHPALDRALYLLSLKLTEALANENSHITKQVSYEFPEIPAPTPFDQFVERADAPCLCGAHRFGPDGHCTNEGCVCCPTEAI